MCNHKKDEHINTIILPDNIRIELVDKNGTPICQNNIVIGIKTFANSKNDINLSPFFSDKKGVIYISKQDLLYRAHIYISYGLMDYSSLESAKQNIEIYFWGLSNINRYLDYWEQIVDNSKYLKQYDLYGDKLGKRDIENALIEKRERQDYEIYKNSFNLQTNITTNLILIKDNWDGKIENRQYTAELKL